MNKKLILFNTTAFLAGFVIMTIEIVGSRVLAPFVGSSIVVWTSIIGVILTSLSIGYYLGGWLADRKTNVQTLSKIILGASIYTGLSAYFSQNVLQLIQSLNVEVGAMSIIASSIILGPESLLLGMVTPYLVRLSITGVKTSGRVTGRLFAFSSVGSIFGTFLTGLILISKFGSSQLLLLSSLILFLLALAFQLAPKFLYFVFLFVIIFSKTPSIQIPGVVLETDSTYQKILILDRTEIDSGRAIRVLSTNLNWADSVMYLDNSSELAAQYTKLFLLAFNFNKDIKSSLLIGGGGYSFPKYYLNNFDSGKIDVVEIDPKVTSIAREYFGLEDSPRLGIYHEDGRVFLNKASTASKKYDAVFIDAFKDRFTIPFHLSTVESMQKVENILSENGVLIVNLLSALEGNGSNFLQAEYKTLSQVFPQVLIFRANNQQKQNSEIQNFFLLALKKEVDPEEIPNWPVSNLADILEEIDISDDSLLLTDNFAPVEQYIIQSY